MIGTQGASAAIDAKVFELLAGTSANADALFADLARAFALLNSNHNAYLLRVPRDESAVEVLGASPAAPGEDRRRWPLDEALCTVFAAPGVISVPLAPDSDWPALTACGPGQLHLCGIALRGADGEASGALVTIGERDPLAEDAAALPVLVNRARHELAAAAATDRLRAELGMYRTAAEVAANRIMIHDASGVLLEVNDSLIPGWPQASGTIIGKHFASVLPDDVALLYENALRHVRQTGESWSGSYAITRGEERRFREVQVAAFDAGHTLTVVRDITERKLAEIGLRESESRLRSLVKHAPIGIFWTDREGAVVYGNPALRESLQLTAEEGHGHAWIQHIHADDRARILATWQAFVSGEQAAFHQEYRYAPAGRPVRIVQTQAVRIRSGEDVIALMGIVLDVTTERQKEQEHRALQAQLQHAQRIEALGQLTAGVAHEFNNILASTLGYAWLVQQNAVINSDPALADHLRQIVTAGERGREVVGRMLSFAQHSAEPSAPIAPQPAIENACRLLRSAIPSRIALSLTIEPGLPLVISTASDLEQVLLNLALNSQDAMNGHGRIEISLRHARHITGVCQACQAQIDGNYVELRVKDDGQGIAGHIMPRIFDPFFTTKGVGQGAGLGLSVVHGVVHRDGGHLQLESSPQTGTSISVLFAAVAEPDAAVSTPAEIGLAPGSGQHRVLVVDDEPSVGNLIRELLEMEGYVVDLHRESTGALAALTATPDRYALLVTDQTMPALSGLELAAAVRARNPHLPILLCTGYKDLMDDATLRAHGITRSFRKPLPIADFLGTVANLLQPAPG